MVYLDAFDEIQQRGDYATSVPVERTPQETMRAVQLAQKIGELAQRDNVAVPPLYASDDDQSQTNEPAEGYLTWSVEEMLRLAQAPRQSDPIVLSDLPLPPWVSEQELGASVEALGAFYASHHKAALAVPLYVQAISTLLPPRSTGSPPKPPPTVADRCRAAILMNNISQALTQDTSDLETLEKAVAWATKGLDLATITSYRAGFMRDMPENEQTWLLRFSGFDPEKVGPVAPVIEVETEARLHQVQQQCLGTQFVLLYNLGMFYSVCIFKLTKKRCGTTRPRHERFSAAQCGMQSVCNYAMHAHSVHARWPDWTVHRLGSTTNFALVIGTMAFPHLTWPAHEAAACHMCLGFGRRTWTTAPVQENRWRFIDAQFSAEFIDRL